ncbi:phosphotransferase [Nocardia cyriacigeorgica]|uniref:phosphotransferase n=1 Tax=Nocardia cyriacigeorgica TaxID=135487 RepID=UPI003CC7F5C7
MPPQETIPSRGRGLAFAGRSVGVLPILAFDDTPEPGWFVMPPAEPLANRLADADFEVTVEVFAQLAEILSHLSNCDEPVFHRDIKPDNLFWYADGPVFGDFGIARWHDLSVSPRTGRRSGPCRFWRPKRGGPPRSRTGMLPICIP